jgi:hypothetical protein
VTELITAILLPVLLMEKTMARYIACLMTLTLFALQSASAQVLTEKSPLDDLSLLPVLDPQVSVKAHKIVVHSCGLEEKRAARDAAGSSVTVNSALLKALQEAVGKDSRIDTFIFVGFSPRQGLQGSTLGCGILRFTYAAEEASQGARTAFPVAPPQAREIVTPVLPERLPVPRPALKAAPAKKAEPQVAAPAKKAAPQVAAPAKKAAPQVAAPAKKAAPQAAAPAKKAAPQPAHSSGAEASPESF